MYGEAAVNRRVPQTREQITPVLDHKPRAERAERPDHGDAVCQPDDVDGDGDGDRSQDRNPERDLVNPLPEDVDPGPILVMLDPDQSRRLAWAPPLRRRRAPPPNGPVGQASPAPGHSLAPRWERGLPFAGGGFTESIIVG